MVDAHTALSIAASKKQLALMTMSQGKHNEALELFNYALSFEVQVLGEGHLTVAKTKLNVGSAYQSKGDLDHAVQFYKEAEMILKSVGDIQAGTALGIVYLNLGSCYLSRGDFEEARASYHNAVLAKSKEFGDDHMQARHYGCKAHTQQKKILIHSRVYFFS
jgi:tetratricopeptide (TPR) repeat protein